MGETQIVRFESATGDALVARLHEPPGAVRAFALFAHCFTCSKDLHAPVRVSAALAIRGIATLRFDFTGLGESEGDFAETGFSSNIADVVAAAGWLREHRQAPRLLIGHSLGGAAVLAAAREIPESVAVATIGAPFDPAHVKKHIRDLDRVERDGEGEVDIGGRPFRIRRRFLEDLERHDMSELERLGRALLIFHAPQDNIVGIDNARQIYEAARHPKSFVTLDGADHLLRARADAEYVADVMSSWASRYLPKDAEATPPAKGEVRVTGGPHGLQQLVEADVHRLWADEPVDMGGAATGPDPYALLLASLGACTSMTLRLYADRKGWPLRAVTVNLAHERVHAKDCEDCASTSGRVAVLTRRIRLDGDLDEAQRARLLEIADRCPVHRTLEGEVKIRTFAEP